jgi:hypothetical protein
MDSQTFFYANHADKLGLLLHDDLLVISSQPFVLDAFKHNAKVPDNVATTQNFNTFMFLTFYDKMFIDASDISFQNILKLMELANEWCLGCIYVYNISAKRKDLQGKFEEELAEYYNWKYCCVLSENKMNNVLIVK